MGVVIGFKFTTESTQTLIVNNLSCLCRNPSGRWDWLARQKLTLHDYMHHIEPISSRVPGRNGHVVHVGFVDVFPQMPGIP